MTSLPTILILNGPNLNLLGTREPDIYGTRTLADIEQACGKQAEKLRLALDFRQSNSEGTLVDWIQEARDGYTGIIINPAAYTHTSIAIVDALKQFSGPIIEIHISNIFSREEMRHHSYVSPVVKGIICGFGGESYTLALQAMAAILEEKVEG